MTSEEEAIAEMDDDDRPAMEYVWSRFSDEDKRANPYSMDGDDWLYDCLMYAGGKGIILPDDILENYRFIADDKENEDIPYIHGLQIILKAQDRLRAEAAQHDVA